MSAPPPPPWYACPQCGNEFDFRHEAGVRGTRQGLAFLDGAKGWWQQRYHVRLTCPCGHAWELLEIAERGRHPRYEPMPPPLPPPTADEQAWIDAGQALRDRRVALGLALGEVAGALGVSPMVISAIERGHTPESDPGIAADLNALLSVWERPL